MAKTPKITGYKPKTSITLYGADAKRLRKAHLDEPITLVIKGKIRDLSIDRGFDGETPRVGIDVKTVKRQK